MQWYVLLFVSCCVCRSVCSDGGIHSMSNDVVERIQ